MSRFSHLLFSCTKSMNRTSTIRPHSHNNGYTVATFWKSGRAFSRKMDILQEASKSWPNGSKGLVEGCLPHVLDAADFKMIKQVGMAWGKEQCSPLVNFSVLPPYQDANLKHRIRESSYQFDRQRNQRTRKGVLTFLLKLRPQALKISMHRGV